MPRDRYMEKKSRSSLMKFGLVGGIESDTDPGRVTVLDSNNVFPSPNGTEAGPRPGCEIRKRYRLSTTPVGRKAIIVETAPPDVSLGYLFMIVNTENSRNAIEAGAFVRDRSQLPFQSTSNQVSMQLSSVTVEFGSNIDVEAYRTGDINQTNVISYSTRNGTALAGSQYVAQSGQFTFSPGIPPGMTMLRTINCTGSGAGDVGKFFFFDIFAQSSNTTIDPISTTIINIVAP